MAGAVYEDPRHYKDDNVVDLCQTAVCCRMPLTRLEPEDRDLLPHSRRLDAIVAVPGIDLLGESIQACVLVGIGHLGRRIGIRGAPSSCSTTADVSVPRSSW